MHPTTNFLINASRKAARLLYRDFCELELLQTSNRGTSAFCSKSYDRTKTLLKEELAKYASNAAELVFFSDEKIDIPANSEIAFLVNPLDSVVNLSKSIPFFGLTITFLKKLNGVMTPTHCIINFPALGEILYSEKGGGTWIETNNQGTLNKTRARISLCNNTDDAVIGLGKISDAGHVASAENSANLRLLGSPCYAVALLAAGKLDAICLSPLHYTLHDAFTCIVKEAGGVALESKQYFYATNINLSTKLV